MLRGRRSPESAAAYQQLLLAQLPGSFVWTTDAELRLTSLGGAALSRLGIDDPEALVGRTVDVLLVARPDGGASVVDAHERALQGESTSLYETAGPVAFDVHIEPLVQDGEIVGAGGIAVDASKRHAAERALVESEARFRTLVERLPICTYVNQLGFPVRTVYISPYVEQLLGFPPEAWLGEDDFWFTQMHPDDADRVRTEAARSHETGEPFSARYRMIAKDGRTVELLDEMVSVSDDRGRPLFLQGFLLEVGQQ